MVVDIFVAGGGPAGVVVAKTLAKNGYRVALAARPRRFPAIEGLSERAIAGLRFAGCHHALERLGSSVLRSAHWNGDRFAGNREWVIERGGFDAALEEDAREAGITLFQGRVSGFKRCDGHWLVTLSSRGCDEITAGFVIDARGRSASHGRNAQHGPATTALGRLWKMPEDGAPGTRVTAFADGWAWFAAGDSGIGILQVFLSTETERLPSRSHLQDFYSRRLHEIPEAQRWLTKAQPMGAIFARYAHPQFDSRLLGERHARVGDAAFAIDPLSGHGMYEAISGALALAATVNTVLAKPEDAEVAKRFYQERIESDFLRMSRIGRDFYRMEQRWPDRPFWRQRQSWPDAEPAHAPPDAEEPRIERRPVNADGFITLQDVIVTPDHPRGLWQVAGVALVPLLRQLRSQQGKTLTEIADSYAESQEGSPEDCKTALAWLASRRLLTLNSP